MPPTETNTNTTLRMRFVEYYWLRHFERNPVDPATFIDRIMTNYAHFKPDVVGEWLRNMSPLMTLYKACLGYGTKHGTPGKAIEAKGFQNVFPYFVGINAYE